MYFANSFWVSKISRPLRHAKVSSQSHLGRLGKRLGLVSVSEAKVSVAVSAWNVSGPSLLSIVVHM